MAGDVDRQDRTEAHPIEGMSKLSLRQIQALKSRWLTSIEAFVGAAATEEGRAGLREALEDASITLDDLLQEARNMLDEQRFRELMRPEPGGQTGALWDDKSGRTGDPNEGGRRA